MDTSGNKMATVARASSFAEPGEREELFTSGGVQVELRGVSKWYGSDRDGEVPAVSEVDLVFERGTATAIMGRSGCGKTTLLNLIGGIDHPRVGSIRYESLEVTVLSARQLEEYRLLKVGFVFQLFNLIPSLTALGNVMLPMILAGMPERKRRARAINLLQQMDIAEKMNRFPDQMSGGQQQRVAVAVALANDPALILADEPTGNLDSKNADAVAELLCSLSRIYGKTVIIVSHDPHIAPRADRTLTMEDGKFISTEPL